VARALGTLTEVDAYFGRGELSYSKVRAIVRVATSQSEQDFIDIAMHCTASQLETFCSGYKRARTDPSDPPLDQRRYVRRRKTRSGMVRLDVQLPPEEANLVWEALQSALDPRPPAATESKTARDGAASPNDSAEPPVEDVGPADHTDHGGNDAADAVTDDSAERSAGQPDGGEQQVENELELEPELPANDPVDYEERRADGLVDVARGYLRARPRTLGAGYELVVMTTPERLRDGIDGIGGFLRDGTPLPLHVVQKLATDCSRVDVEIDEKGEVLDVGRRTRTIPPAIARALWLRDGQCRFPGCTQKTHLRAHHILFWMYGGATSLANLCLLCGFHHGIVHDGKVAIEVEDGQIRFIDQWGKAMPASPPTAATGHDLEELEAFLRDADVHIDPSINAPRWDGTPLDLDGALAWMDVAESSRPFASA
jgi:hypothetical protein